MDSQKFGTFIAQCRKDKKMTQSDLAAKLNVTDKAISRWERGVGFPDINTIEPLAAALDVSVAELMKSERIDESEMSIAMNNEIVNNALNFAEKQIQQERKNVFSIIGCLTVAIIFILYLDNIGWARHLSFYSSGDNSPIDSNPLVPCAAGIRYIPKVQRPVLPPNLFDCPCRLGDSCSDIWCLYAGWNFGVRPCASVNISRVWGRHAPTRALRKLT